MANKEEDKKTDGKKSDRLVHDACVLFVITIIAGLCLGGVYAITKEPIAKANEEKKQESYQKVFADATFEEDSAVTDALAAFTKEEVLASSGLEDVEIAEVLAAKDSSGADAGYVVQVSAKGYGGAVVLAVGIDGGGTIKAVDILAADDETPGLGQRCTEPDWNGQYVDKSTKDLNLEVVKGDAVDDNQIEAISGATITSSAVTRAINGALLFIASLEEGGSHE